MLFVLLVAALPAHPQRIVSLAPALSEIVCALGGEAHLVGVTRFDDFPGSLKRLPKVGGFTDPSVEAIAALHPDLVLMNPNESNENLTHALDALHIPWLSLADARLEDFAPMVRAVAALLETSGEKLVTDFAQGLAALPHKKGRALIVYGHAPIVAAGPGSFGDELLRRVGLQNAYTGQQRYPHLDTEDVLNARPDWLLDLDMGEGSFDAQPFSARSIVVRKISDPALLRLGPRLPAAMARLVSAL